MMFRVNFRLGNSEHVRGKNVIFTGNYAQVEIISRAMNWLKAEYPGDKIEIISVQRFKNPEIIDL